MPIINAADLDISAPEWLVEGMIPRTGIGFLYGPRTVGKSLVTNGELALAVANGTNFFGRKTTHGSVVTCYGEGTADAGIRLAARLARQNADNAAATATIRAQCGDEAAGAFAAALPAYTDERVFPLIGAPFIMHTNTEGEPTRSLVSAVNEMKQVPDLELVIIDTLSRFTGGLSISNDASASRCVLGLLYMARELNCCILVVCHPTEKGDKMLGAGVLGNAADFIIRITPELTGQPGEPKSATIECEKVKQGEEFDPISYTIHGVIVDAPVMGEDNQPTGETEPVKTATIRRRNDTSTGGGLRLPTTEPNAPRIIQPARVLPAIHDVPQRHKRSGIRQQPAPPTAPTKPMPSLAEVAGRDARVTALLTGDCPECGATAGQGCSVAGTSPYIRLTDEDPVIAVHIARAKAAIEAGHIDPDSLTAQTEDPDGVLAPVLAATGGTP